MPLVSRGESIAVIIGIATVHALYFHAMSHDFGMPKSMLVSSLPFFSMLFKIWWSKRNATPSDAQQPF